MICADLEEKSSHGEERRSFALRSIPVMNDDLPILMDDPLSILGSFLRKLFSLWVSSTYPFASVGRRLSIDRNCELHRAAARFIELGNAVCIHNSVWINVPLPPSRNGEPAIIIGDRCNIARRSIISAKNCIHFEPDVMFGPGAIVVDHSHAYEDVTRPISQQGITEGGRVRIGQGSWIGHNAAIVCASGDLTLGRNCVVAANSLVTKSVPPFSVVSGNPARVVKQFDPVKQMWVMGGVRPAEPIGH